MDFGTIPVLSAMIRPDRDGAHPAGKMGALGLYAAFVCWLLVESPSVVDTLGF